MMQPAAVLVALLLAQGGRLPAAAQGAPDEAALTKLLEDADPSITRVGSLAWRSSAVGVYKDRLELSLAVQDGALIVEAGLDGLPPSLVDLDAAHGTARLSRTSAGRVAATARRSLAGLDPAGVLQMTIDVANLADLSYGRPQAGLLWDPDCRLQLPFDTAVWSRSPLPMILALDHVGGEAAVIVKLGAPGPSTAEVAEDALREARAADPAMRIVKRGRKTVGALELESVEYEAGVGDGPGTYFAYFHGGPQGAVALQGYTHRSRAAELRPVFEKLAEGLGAAR